MKRVERVTVKNPAVNRVKDSTIGEICVKNLFSKAFRIFVLLYTAPVPIKPFWDPSDISPFHRTNGTNPFYCSHSITPFISLFAFMSEREGWAAIRVSLKLARCLLKCPSKCQVSSLSQTFSMPNLGKSDTLRTNHKNVYICVWLWRFEWHLEALSVF